MAQQKIDRVVGGGIYTAVVSADSDPERWLVERRKLLTATDIPSILGVPGARDALETWYQKKDALVGRAEAQATREAKQAGHDFEDFNALMFSKSTGRHVDREQHLLRSDKYPWLGCTLDYTQRWVEDGDGTGIRRTGTRSSRFGPLETKNAGSFAADEMWPVGGEPHLTWQVQLTVQMLVLAVDVGSLSAWLGSPFVHHRWCDLERDKALCEIILEEGSRFWKSLKRKSPSKDLVNPATAYEVLRRLSPATATRKVISLPREAVNIDCNIKVLQDAYDKEKRMLDLRKEALEAERAKLAALIGENDGGKLTGGDVWTFRHVHVPAHAVAAHSYRKLNRQSAGSSKPRKTTWKTSK